MSTLEPGLYRATVRGVANQVVMLLSGDNCAWSFEYIDGNRCHQRGDVTDARPLIVLEIGCGDTPFIIEALRDAGHDDYADQIHEQTKPARIPEPGLWGVVEAAPVGRPEEVRAWVRGIDWWVRLSDGTGVRWESLIDPILIRDGIES